MERSVNGSVLLLPEFPREAPRVQDGDRRELCRVKGHVGTDGAPKVKMHALVSQENQILRKEQMLGPREEEAKGGGPDLRTKLLPRIPRQAFSTTVKTARPMHRREQGQVKEEMLTTPQIPRSGACQHLVNTCRHKVFSVHSQIGSWMHK